MNSADELELLTLRRRRAQAQAVQSGSAGDISDSKDLIASPAERLKTVPGEQQAQVDKAQQAAFSSAPIMDRLLAGAGHTLYNTGEGLAQLVSSKLNPFNLGSNTPAYNARQQNLQAESGTYNTASQGDTPSRLGEVGADLGLAALPMGRAVEAANALKAPAFAGLNMLAPSAAAATASAGQHQIQNMGQGAAPNLNDALAEIVTGTATGYLGGMAGQYLKDKAPEILQSAVKPKEKYLQGKTANPAQFDKVLESGSQPYFGGLEKTKANLNQIVGTVADARDELLDKAGTKINISGAISQAQKNIMARHDLDWGDKIAALKYAENAKQNAAQKSSATGTSSVWTSSTDASDLRKLADKYSRFTPEKVPPAQAIFNESYRDALESQQTARLGQTNVLSKIGPDADQKYLDLKKQMADLIPARNAIADRVTKQKNNYKVGLIQHGVGGTLGAAVGGAEGGEHGHAGAGALLGGLLGVGGTRLLTTPGGSAMLYDLGSLLSAHGPASYAPGQVMRSGLFGGSGLNQMISQDMIPQNLIPFRPRQMAADSISNQFAQR